MKKIISSALIFSILIFSGCVEKSVQGNINEDLHNYIVFNMGKEPEDLVMFNNSNIRQQDLLCNIFEGLVKTDDKGKIIPGLAESWIINKDETSYNFKIRQDAKWSDGSHITAFDFVDFFSQVLSKDIDNIYASQLYYIFGAEEYRKGQREFSNVAIRALDDKNLEIRLNYPCSYLLNILSEPIYSLRKIEHNLVEWKKSYKNILYTGSFKIDNISEKNEITLVKNQNYWDSQYVKSDKILVTCIDESEATLAAFQNGKVKLFVSPPISEVKNLINSGEIINLPSFSGSALVFNEKKDSIIKDENVRKAISVGIDRNNISKTILSDTVRPALSYVPSNINNGSGGTFTNKNVFQSTLEKEKALQLTKKSKLDKNSPTIKLIYVDTVENKKICDSIAKSLYDNLSIKVESQGYSPTEFDDELKKNDYNIAKINYEGLYDYPLTFLENWMSSSDSNFYGYNNPQFDNTVTKARMEQDKNKKLELMKEAENIILGDAEVVPLYFNNILLCKKGNVEGVYTTKRGNVKLEKAYIAVNP
ncbi:peptide ABC transporter substrate-binding protein [Clostridium sp. DJ247]|uniref:peptide ABC transporter substrate-binding protein n=1 Tax=Clostridium sp. DJ247 TaxID=2726188 RepID=UPI0016260673|nr:peptide ABC transporter substrate-binding protein [Clostridium sp. DJ247]MBC2582722.1 peptide ABC transporter substrate-binding protein [Clostridium sp. DJ247]